MTAAPGFKGFQQTPGGIVAGFCHAAIRCSAADFIAAAIIFKLRSAGSSRAVALHPGKKQLPQRRVLVHLAGAGSYLPGTAHRGHLLPDLQTELRGRLQHRTHAGCGRSFITRASADAPGAGNILLPGSDHLVKQLGTLRNGEGIPMPGKIKGLEWLRAREKGERTRVIPTAHLVRSVKCQGITGICSILHLEQTVPVTPDLRNSIIYPMDSQISRHILNHHTIRAGIGKQ